jgi:hypothetical protein
MKKRSVEVWEIQCPDGFLSQYKQQTLGTDNIIGCLFIVFLSKLILSAPIYFPSSLIYIAQNFAIFKNILHCFY